MRLRLVGNIGETCLRFQSLVLFQAVADGGVDASNENAVQG